MRLIVSKMSVSEMALGLTVLSLVIWIGLLGFRGQFWRCDQHLQAQATDLERLPSVWAVIPARNEAELLPVTVRSLLTQDYPGSFKIILVDDHSTDGTADVAHRVAQKLDKTQQLHILSAEPLPPGWTGKLWALQQGIGYAQGQLQGDYPHTPPPDYFLLTDADIEHTPSNLRELVNQAQQEDLDLVSLMVRLRCESFWERFLIPAFVFFFQKLYPFGWVNDPTKSTAAAAGGCILIRREALTRIGGIQVVRNALIDDCALAQAVKLVRSPQPPLKRGASFSTPQPSLEKGASFPPPQSSLERGASFSPIPPLLEKGASFSPPQPSLEKGAFPQLTTPLVKGGKGGSREECSSNGRIWLGLSDSTRSLRPYPSLATIWEMVARTAFTQLNYSLWLLLGTVIGMTIVYIVPPVGAVWGVVTGNWLIAIASFLSWLLMAYAYLPTIRLYGCSPWLAFSLPAIAFLYSLMTLDSAWRHWRHQGGNWKGRVYSETLGNG